MRIALITAIILSTVAGGHALAQTSAPSSPPSAPATAPAPAPQAAPGAPPSGGPALAPTPATGGVVQSPSPATNSTPSQTNVDLFPPSRLTTPGAPAGAPSPNQMSPGQAAPGQVAPGQSPLGQSPQSASRPQPGGANSSAPAANPKKTGNDYSLAECMGLWDAGTHMSKGDWREACKRVQKRLDNLDAIAVETNQKRGRRESGLGVDRRSN